MRRELQIPMSKLRCDQQNSQGRKVKANKLFVFRPCRYWDNTGCVIIAAKSFDHVQDVIDQYNELEIEKDILKEEVLLEFGFYSDEFLSLPDGNPFVEEFLLKDDKEFKMSWVLSQTYDLKTSVLAGVSFKNSAWSGDLW